jgi:hypothetical protein
MVFTLGELRLYQRNAAHDPMTLSVVLIYARGTFDQLNDLLEEFRCARTEFIVKRLTKYKVLTSVH